MRTACQRAGRQERVGNWVRRASKQHSVTGAGTRSAENMKRDTHCVGKWGCHVSWYHFNSCPLHKEYGVYARNKEIMNPKGWGSPTHKHPSFCPMSHLLG